MRATEVLVFGLDHPEGVCWDRGARLRLGRRRGRAALSGRARGAHLRRGGPRARVRARARARRPRPARPLLPGGGGARLGRRAVHADRDRPDLRELSGVRARRDALRLGLRHLAARRRSHPSDRGGRRPWRRSPSERPCFTNGLAVSPDGRHLWLVESADPRVSRVELATGRCETVARIDGAVLDGLAFTDAGGLLVSCYRPDRIYHLDADGALEIVADDPQGTILSAPTNVCFVGPELDRVVAANLGRWHLTLLELGLRGAPLHRPERWALDAR